MIKWTNYTAAMIWCLSFMIKNVALSTWIRRKEKKEKRMKKKRRMIGIKKYNDDDMMYFIDFPFAKQKCVIVRGF